MKTVKVRYIGSLPRVMTEAGVIVRGEAREIPASLAGRLCATPRYELVEEAPKPARSRRSASSAAESEKKEVDNDR